MGVYVHKKYILHPLQYPDLQWLVMSGKNAAHQVIEVKFTALTLVPLTMALSSSLPRLITSRLLQPGQ